MPLSRMDSVTVETPEYKEFTKQLADLQKSYSGSFLVVSHPPERGAHDDYPDSWALALWGAKDPGYVDTTETACRSTIVKDNYEITKRSMNRNRRTAKRR